MGANKPLAPPSGSAITPNTRANANSASGRGGTMTPATATKFTAPPNESDDGWIDRGGETGMPNPGHGVVMGNTVPGAGNCS